MIFKKKSFQVKTKKFNNDCFMWNCCAVLINVSVLDKKFSGKKSTYLVRFDVSAGILCFFIFFVINTYARYSFITPDRDQPLEAGKKKKKTFKKGQKIALIIWYSLLFQSRQKDISLPLTDLPPLLMDVFTIALAESRGTLEKTHFESFTTVLQPHHGVLSPAFEFSRHYIFALSLHFTVHSEKKQNQIRSPPLMSLLVVKMTQKVFRISAGLHSHTWQIYTVRSCHTCGDPFSDRVVCPSRLCGLQIEPFGLRKVVSLIWPFSKRLRSFDEATVGAEWRHQGLCRRCWACLHARLLPEPDQGV